MKYVKESNLEPINSLEELLFEAKETSKARKERYCSFTNLKIETNLEVPLNDAHVKSALSNLQNKGETKRSEFISIRHTTNKKNLEFINCEFKEAFHPLETEHNYLEFKNCHFESIDFNNSTVNSKVKFTHCSFSKVNFRNTTFSNLADFFDCWFNEEVIFYKTDFLGTTVFSATTFHENVLFTYSLIDKLIIFRGTRFKKGLDLSCAIISGDINPFDIRLENYASEVIKESDPKKYEEIYEKHICKEGKIPIKNQRETYRILKEAFIKREDIASSIKYKVLEKETLRKELEVVTYSPTTLAKKCPGLDKKLFQIENWFEKLNLWLNKWSNNYGKSYSRALVFILVIGFIFFYFSAIASSKYYFAWDIEFCEGLGDFAQFLLPTHDIEYLGLKKYQPTEFFVLDFLGRLVVGYGIYQFITAFRKYR